MGFSLLTKREQNPKHDKASARAHPGSESRADVKRVSREHGRASCFPDETIPVIGQLVDLSPGIPEVSHSRYKRSTETRQGYRIRAKSEVKKQTEAVLVPS